MNDYAILSQTLYHPGFDSEIEPIWHFCINRYAIIAYALFISHITSFELYG